MYQNVRGFVTRSLNNNFISITLKENYTKQFNKSHVGHLRNMQWMNLYKNVRGVVARSLNKIFISFTLKGNYTKQFDKGHTGHLRNMQSRNLYNDDLAIQGAARPGPLFAAPESE